MSQIPLTRREFLYGTAAAAGMAMLGGTELFAAQRALAAPVAIGRCRTYENADGCRNGTSGSHPACSTRTSDAGVSTSTSPAAAARGW